MGTWSIEISSTIKKTMLDNMIQLPNHFFANSVEALHQIWMTLSITLTCTYLIGLAELLPRLFSHSISHSSQEKENRRQYAHYLSTPAQTGNSSEMFIQVKESFISYHDKDIFYNFVIL